MAIGHRGPAKTSSEQALDGINGLNPFPKQPQQSISYSGGVDSSELKNGDFFHPQNAQYPQGISRHPQGPFSDFLPSQYGAVPTHSQRQSISGPSSSVAGPGPRGLRSASGLHTEEGDLPHLMAGMTLDGPPSSISNFQGFQPSQPSFQPSQPSFQFNPISQPWSNVTTTGLGGFDAYGVGRRDSAIDRSSPASAYPSHRSFAGTPQTTKETWGSRPGSRDHRMPADPDPRGYLPEGYLHPQPQQFPPHLVNQGFPPFANNFQPQGYGYQGFAQPQGYRTQTDKDKDSLDRSPLLQEFRAYVKSGRLDRDKRWELRDIFGHVCEFSGDQHGSRFIQGKLETANSDEKSTVFEEICPNALALMKDIFGNYVIQKLFEHGNLAQKRVLAGKMRGWVEVLSRQMYACRVVQKALEHVLVEQQAELVKELEPDIMNLMMDQNGNHVIQKVVELVPREYIGFIMDCFKGRVNALSEHQYACRVIQRALEHGSEQDKRAILNEVHEHIPMMVMNQFGNYVAQHVIEKGDRKDAARIIAYVTSHLSTLSRHKFASNVAEACLKHGTDEERKRILDQLLGRGDGDESPLLAIMKDQYGNYVIQKLCGILKGSELAALVAAMRPLILDLKKAGPAAAKHVSNLEKLIFESSKTPASSTPTSPGLQGDGGSTAPTPSLTTEPNSPSSNPPSTEASSVGEAEHQPNGKPNGMKTNGTAKVKVRDDAC
ncbi:Armadillo-type fold [Naviculisporaceae sp. PSN 640]